MSFLSYPSMAHNSVHAAKTLPHSPQTNSDPRSMMHDQVSPQSALRFPAGDAASLPGRLPELAPATLYGLTAYPAQLGAALGYPGFAVDPALLQSTLSRVDPKELPMGWGAQTPFYHPYDPALHPFIYSAGYRGLGLDGARRKNATRETTATLKAWLNEHRKNPYPTKAEKIMLAIMSKMTLTQVSTWFANARRRLKKENQMTWSPRNKSNDDRDSDDDVIAADDMAAQLAERPGGSRECPSTEDRHHNLHVDADAGSSVVSGRDQRGEGEGSDTSLMEHHQHMFLRHLASLPPHLRQLPDAFRHYHHHHHQQQQHQQQHQRTPSLSTNPPQLPRMPPVLYKDAHQKKAIHDQSSPTASSQPQHPIRRSSISSSSASGSSAHDQSPSPPSRHDHHPPPHQAAHQEGRFPRFISACAVADDRAQSSSSSTPSLASGRRHSEQPITRHLPVSPLEDRYRAITTDASRSRAAAVGRKQEAERSSAKKPKIWSPIDDDDSGDAETRTLTSRSHSEGGNERRWTTRESPQEVPKSAPPRVDSAEKCDDNKQGGAPPTSSFHLPPSHATFAHAWLEQYQRQLRCHPSHFQSLAAALASMHSRAAAAEAAHQQPFVNLQHRNNVVAGFLLSSKIDDAPAADSDSDSNSKSASDVSYDVKATAVNSGHLNRAAMNMTSNVAMARQFSGEMKVDDGSNVQLPSIIAS